MTIEPIRAWLMARHLCGPSGCSEARCLGVPFIGIQRIRSAPVVAVVRGHSIAIARNERIVLQAALAELFGQAEPRPPVDGPSSDKAKLKLAWPSDELPAIEAKLMPIIEWIARPWLPMVTAGAITDLLT